MILNEIFFVTAHAGCNPQFITQHIGDPVSQTRLILAQMKDFLEEVGFRINGIVRTDWTFFSEVNGEQFGEIAGVWEEFLVDVEVKATIGTLRYVQRLGMPDMMVEYEMMLAK